MKRNESGHRISFLLARYYLAFTLVLIALFYGTYRLWDFCSAQLLKSPDPDSLIQSSSFRSGDFSAVNPERFLGRSGAFAVLGADGSCLYASSDALPLPVSPDELLCIASSDSPYAVSSLSFETPEGEHRQILTRDRLQEDGTVTTEVMVLGEDLQVLDGSLIPGKTRYTPTELRYLTNSWSDQFLLTQSPADLADGTPVTVLFLLPQYSDAYYQEAFDRAGQLWLLAIPLYLLATLLFIVLLNRHFRRPLERLGAAIVRLGAGEEVSASACGGPAEIRQLGRSFDEMAASLAESRAETRRLEEQRIKMLTDISHDLKTPLTVITGYTSAIRDGKVPPEELPEYLEIISRKADGLAELINSFHEYSKTEHPDFRLEKTDADLCEFLREYLADKFQEIDLAGFMLEVEIPDGLRIPCRIDRFQLRRALDNILANSLRHNRLGTVIRVSVHRTSQGAVLRLADNGNGIPKALREDLFTPFTVGDQSRSKGGSGLGLAIARKILEAHGWSIRLLPDCPGTAFEISVPAL